MRARRIHGSFASCLLVFASIGLVLSPAVAWGERLTPPLPSDLTPPPNLGALLPLTGALSIFGVSMANAVQLLQGQVNDAGGFHGTNLTIHVADTQSTPTGANAGATDLIQQHGVQAIVGGAASGETLAAFQVAGPAGVLMMSPSATSSLLTNFESNDLLWRTTASDALQGKAAAGLAYTNLSYRRIGILAANDPYGTGIATAFSENFTALGGNVTITVLFNPNQTDYSSDLTALFSTNPEAVYLVAFPQNGLTILWNWWQNHGAWPTHWILTDGMSDQPTMDQLRAQGVNNTGFIGLNQSRSPAATGMNAYEAFRAAYASRYGEEPIIFSENAYDSAFVVALAMYASNSTDPAVFKTAIRYVANPPGLPILPGQWTQAVAALDAGQDIEYWGGANRVDFDSFGDTGTAYSVWAINDTGVIGIVNVLDEPFFWTPADEGPLPLRVQVDSPAAGSFLRGVATITGKADPSQGVVAVQVRFDSGTWQNATGTSTWTFDLDTTALADGSHRIAARSFDGANYSSEATVDITTDNTPPSISILTPQSAGYVAASFFSASWSSADPVSGVEKTEVRLDAGDPVLLPGDAAGMTFVDISEGGHTLLIRAIDRAGNSGEASVAFTADGQPPSTSVTIDGTQGTAFWFTSEVRVSLAAQDSGAGVGTIFIRVGAEPWQSYAAPLVLSNDGIHDVSYYADDWVRNTGATTTVQIRIDRTNPQLTITPMATLLTKSDITIGWTGSDATSGIGRYEIRVDNGPFQSVSMETMKGLTLTDGDHEIDVRAVDNAGLSATESVHVRVDTNVFSFSGPYGGAPTIVLPASIAAIALLLLWRYRRMHRGRQESPPEKPDGNPPR